MTWPLIVRPAAQLDIEEAASRYESRRWPLAIPRSGPGCPAGSAPSVSVRRVLRPRRSDHRDHRYSVLLLVFAKLLKEGWLRESDLEGIRQDRIERIKHLASM
jgi:hypothetical protein